MNSGKRKTPAAAVRACIVLGALVFAAGLQAEIVVLRKGPPVEGRIVRQTSTSIELTTPKGNKTIQKRDIARIQYVSVTNEQKRLLAEKQKKLEAERKAERERIEREKMAEAERARRLKELEDRILAEKKKEAQERAERAEALRDLVRNGQMAKPADEPISYWDFAGRSLLLPGWGHFTLDRPVIGTAYMVGWAAVLSNLAYRYKVGSQAKSINDREVLNNTLLVVAAKQGSLTPEQQQAATAYSYDANGKMLTVYQKKIDNYQYSLFLVGAFYGAQLLHIIYNGIAWEKGLLIVDGKIDEPKEGSIRPVFAVAPTEGQAGRFGRGADVHFGMVYYF